MKKVAFLCAALAAVNMSCGKKGGGGWLVGAEGLMVNVDEDGKLGEGYDLGATEQLNAIACRYEAEAWVVGHHGTLLYTSDGGASWAHHDVGTTANLRSIATQDAGPVFIAGDGVFLTGNPAFENGNAQWTNLGDGVTSYISVATSQENSTVLAVSADGGVFAVEAGALSKVTTLAGMRAIAVSLDGAYAIAVGDGIHQSFDAGRTWKAVDVDPTFKYEDVRIEKGGEAVAVGAAGVVSRIDSEGRVLTQRLGTADLKTVHVQPSDDYTGRGYAAGEGGQIWITEDSGWTWEMGPNVGRTILGADEIGLGHN